jgi:hypothetical protein
MEGATDYEDESSLKNPVNQVLAALTVCSASKPYDTGNTTGDTYSSHSRRTDAASQADGAVARTA